MRKIFQYIRRRPKHVRDNYAFGLASTFTFTVLMFWVMSFSGGEIQAQDGVVAQEKNIPFATLIKQSKEQLALLREAVSSATTTASENKTEASPTVVATNTSQLILSPEDIEKAQTDWEKGTTTSFTSEKVYQEVIIATTSTPRAETSGESVSSEGNASTSVQ